MQPTITITGNLGSDPEMRYTPAGKAVTNISVATNRKYKTGDGTEVEEVIWWRVSFWEGAAETINEYFSKGMPITLKGRLRPNEKGNPRVFQLKSGDWGASYELTAQEWGFVATGEGGGAPRAEAGQVSEPEDIPF
jgi:single-strand DNA-binding protein